jgi:hypothetical protein
MRAQIRRESRHAGRRLRHPLLQPDSGEIRPRIDTEDTFALLVFVPTIEAERKTTATGLDPSFDPSAYGMVSKHCRDTFEFDPAQHICGG